MSSGRCQLFDLRHDPSKFGHKRGHPTLTIRLYERPVVPEGALPAAVEPLPETLAVYTVVREDRSRVVELVGCRDEPDGRRRPTEMGDVRLLSLLPRGLRHHVCVATALHDVRHAVSKGAPNLLQCLLAPLVLDSIVKKR